MLKYMHGAYIFAETIWETDRKVRQYLAEMGPQGYFACLSQPHESALLYP